MKFGERFLSSQHSPWSDHYIDYSRLKRLLRTLFDLGSSDESSACSSRSAAAVDRAVVAWDHRPPPPAGGRSPSSRRPSPDGVDDRVVDSTPPPPRDDPAESSDDRGGGGGGGAIAEGAPPDPPRCRTSASFESELKIELRRPLYFLLERTGGLASDLSALADRRRSLSRDVARALAEETDKAARGGGTTRDRLLGEVGGLRSEYLSKIGVGLLLLLEFAEWNVEAIIKVVKKHDKLLARWEGSHRNAMRGGGGRRRSR